MRELLPLQHINFTELIKIVMKTLSGRFVIIQATKALLPRLLQIITINYYNVLQTQFFETPTSHARYHKRNVNVVSVDDYSLVTLYLRLNIPKKESLIKISITSNV